jgi:1-phosphatidylinositol phosphodiesterase
LISACVTAHEHGGYSQERNVEYTNTHWMATIPDQTKLSEISMVGTHDSGAFESVGLLSDSVLTQSMNYATQLNSGVRAFDIRLRHIGNSFTIHHGAFYLYSNFNDVMNAVTSFLAANPSEIVVIRVGSAGVSHADNNTRSYSSTFDWYMSTYADYHWTSHSTHLNPSMGDVRGKFVLLLDDNNINSDHGIHYGTQNIQDDYSMTTNWSLYSKWEKVKAQLNNASAGKADTFYMNYLSGSGGSMPYFVASGHSNPATGAPRLSTGLTTPGWKNSYPDFPRVDCFIGICTIAFEGTNVLTTNYLNQGNSKHRIGIIMVDFPGPSLIQAVIQRNAVIDVVLKNSTSNKCLDTSGNYENGAATHLWNCGLNNVNQPWIMDFEGKIRSASQTSKCLDPRGPSINAGTVVQMWDCVEGYTWQRWSKYADGSIRPLNDTNKCIEISGVGNGSAIKLNYCNGGNDQIWHWYAPLQNRWDGKCLDVEGGDYSDGGNVQTYPCVGDSNQKWFYDSSTEQLKTINGFCLDNRADTFIHGRINLWTCQNSNINQQWYWQDGALISRQSGLALSNNYTVSTTTTQGAQVDQYPNLYSKQKWYRP